MTAQPTTLAELFGADDERLASAARQDSSAFAELYHRHLTRVYRFHLARTGHVQDAQDLTTQTFMAALKNIHTYRGSGSFAAWLFGIARNQVAMHHRSRRPSAGLEEAERVPDPLPLPEAITERRLQLGQVSQAMEHLTAEQSAAIQLIIFAELSAAEAGAVLGKSEAAMKMLLLRGLKALREALSETEEVL
jgi:RNA polymerase sigma-70 factor (ECF subfamily)